MNYVYAQNIRVDHVGAQTVPGVVSEAELEQTIGVSLIADYNEQLAKIAETMKNQLDQKKAVRDEIFELETMKGKPETIIDQQTMVELTKEEAEKLDVVLISKPILNDRGQTVGYYLDKETFNERITAAVEKKERELTELNSTSELTMLQVQSLVDQRKNALMMLSNLVANKNETMMSIIRNMKT